jgi:hypothetical protein
MLAASLLLLGAGCAPTPSVPGRPVIDESPAALELGASAALTVGATATYADGLTVTLTAINDSRCKPDVVCIWAGELSAALSVHGGKAGDTAIEIFLGTARGPEKTEAGYLFTLSAIDETSATVTVAEAQEQPYADQITVSTPSADAVVTSPLRIEGMARGPWYFEASFPVRLLDANGAEIAVHHAEAQGEWMTEEFVPFVADLEFSEPVTDTGTLVLQNDNPSGMPEHAKEIRIPVRFHP